MKRYLCAIALLVSLAMGVSTPLSAQIDNSATSRWVIPWSVFYELPGTCYPGSYLTSRVTGHVYVCSTDPTKPNTLVDLVASASNGDGVSSVFKCAAASASGTAYTCTTSPSYVPVARDYILFRADVANTGAATLSVNGTTAVPITKLGSTSSLATNDMLASQWLPMVYDGANWQVIGLLGNAGGGGGGSGTVTNLATGCGITGGPVTTTGTLAEQILTATHNGSYAIVTGDCGKSLTTNTAAAWTIAQSGTTGFEAGKMWIIQNIGSGSLTVTATTSTFYGGATANISGSVLTIPANTGVEIISDGTNYQVFAGSGGAGTATTPLVYTSSFGGNIATAQAAISSGGTIVVNQNTTLGSAVALLSNITVACLPNVTITRTGTAAPAFTATGVNHVTVTGCNIVGGNQSFQYNNVGDWWITGNYISGWGTNAIATGQPAFNGHIIGNTIFSCAAGCSDAIFVQDPGEKIAIDSNIIDTTGAANNGSGVGGKAISMHTFAAGGTGNAVSITNNKIHHAGGNFAIEVGSFGASSVNPLQTVVSGNVINTLTGNNGCISFNKVTGGTVISNGCDVGATSPQIGGIEMAASPNSIIANNVVSGMPFDGRSIIIDSSTGARVTNNTVNGLVFIVDSGTFAGSLSISDTLVQGNLITNTVGGTWVKGLIYAQCNVTSCVGSNMQILGNRLVGTSVSSSFGIYFENNTGTMANELLQNNTITGTTTDSGSAGTVTYTTPPAASIAFQSGGTSVGSAGTLNLVSGTYVTCVPTITTGVTTQQCDLITALAPTKANIQSGASQTVTTTSSSGTTYTGTMAPSLIGYTKDSVLTWDIGATGFSGGATTLDIDTQGAKSIFRADGSSNPVAGDGPANQILRIAYNGTAWRIITAGTSGSGVTSVATTGPITGGTITTTGTIACATCTTSSSPGVGVGHFAGGTQALTSSLIVNADITASTIDLTAKVTGVLPAANGGTGSSTRPWGCTVITGDPGAASPVLANDNDSPVACANNTGVDVTITTVAAWADAGSPTVTPILTGGSGTSILTGALTAGTASWAAGTVNGTVTLHSFSGTGATCSSTPCTIDSNITTAGGTAKYLVVKITGTY